MMYLYTINLPWYDIKNVISHKKQHHSSCMTLLAKLKLGNEISSMSHHLHFVTPRQLQLSHVLWFERHPASAIITCLSCGHVQLLGVTMSPDLSLELETHVSVVSAACFYHLRQICCVRQSLDMDWIGLDCAVFYVPTNTV